MANRKGKFEEFNDGLASVYFVDEEDRLIIKSKNIRYGEEVTGIQRYYGAKAVGEEISKTIHVPLIKGVVTHDVIMIDGMQFMIESIQIDKSTLPPILRIQLQKLEIHRQKEVVENE